jgi:hypothetical protein
MPAAVVGHVAYVLLECVTSARARWGRWDGQRTTTLAQGGNRQKRPSLSNRID